MLSFTRYQWTVLAAAWLGWGFDVFDGLLFNYVAPNAVPTLLGLTLLASWQVARWWRRFERVPATISPPRQEP
mgnify:CR=1 FL=1